MARYVDGFVIPLPKKNVPAYKKMAQKAAKIWHEYGALEYRECVGDDIHHKMPLTFPGMTGLKRGETVMFAWIVYRSRAQRDKVNSQVMKDPRIAKMMEGKKPPFDVNRMAFGGFEVLVDA